VRNRAVPDPDPANSPPSNSSGLDGGDQEASRIYSTVVMSRRDTNADARMTVDITHAPNGVSSTDATDAETSLHFEFLQFSTASENKIPESAAVEAYTR
jgi:hypothetical protein